MLTPKQIAAHYGCTDACVRLWIKSGALKVERPGGSRGRIFVTYAEFERFRLYGPAKKETHAAEKPAAARKPARSRRRGR